MDNTGASLAEAAKNIRLDSRNIKVKLAIIPSQEVQEQMFQLLKQHAEAQGNPDPKFGTAIGSGPDFLTLTVDEAIEFLQKLKFKP
jgi:hypothetical protein